MKKKRVNIISFRWAWKSLREWLKKNCIDIDTYQLGSMKYCLDKYYETLKSKRPNVKSTILLMREYNNPGSPIFKGIRVPGLTLEKKSRKTQKNEYKRYIQSAKWRSFKSKILKARGEACEKCGTKTNRLDLHHKTYARLFNELPEDVILLCRPCHKETHEIV